MQLPWRSALRRCVAGAVLFGAAGTAFRAPPDLSAAAPTRRRCICGRTGSVGAAARHATLLAIGTADTLAYRRLPSGFIAGVQRIRITRAWRWPGGDTVPPRYIEVHALLSSCESGLDRGEPYVVHATHDVMPGEADSVLRLEGQCGLGGPADTSGPAAPRRRASYSEENFRQRARWRAAELDSIRQALGPGVEPRP
jgi:hypothetical protein